jgi:glycosyl transferase family 11
MVIVQLNGGLGNQMFQYATGKRLALTNQVPLKLDLTYLLARNYEESRTNRDYALDIFNLQVNFASEEEISNFTVPRYQNKSYFWLKKLLTKERNVIREKQFSFDKNILLAGKDCYLTGNWQSHKYFDDISKELREDFTIKNCFSQLSQEFEQKIKLSNSVCIHVRRGDFVSNSKINRCHGHCTLDYFNKGISLISNQVKNPHFFVFSDDIDWCKEHFNLDYPCTVVQIENTNKRFATDLKLMISCKHFIISNSTFACWAVWLNEQKKKLVIAPKNWFLKKKYNTEDLIPNDWIKI